MQPAFSRALKALLIIGWIIGFVPLAPAWCSAQPALIPCTIHEDFEGGGFCGWSSYPPFEDGAYDFTLANATERPRTQLQGYPTEGEFSYPDALPAPAHPQNNKHYLLRAYHPASSFPQSIGVARQVDLWSTTQSAFTFDYWLSPGSGKREMLLEASTKDGRRFIDRLPLPQDAEGAGWTHLSIPLSELHDSTGSLTASLHLDAVAIVCDIARGDTASIFHFAIDNFELNGARMAHLELAAPQTHRAPLWPVQFADKTFHPGDILSIRVAPEQAIVRGSYRLEDYFGKHVLASGSLQQQGMQWVGEHAYTFSAADACGPLRLCLDAATDTGAAIHDEARLWLLRPPTQPHPRLFFDEKTLQQMIATAHSPTAGKGWKDYFEAAAHDRSHVIPDNPHFELLSHDYLLKDVDPYVQTLRNSSSAVLENAIAGYFGQNQEALNYARHGLVTMCQWPQFIHPWFTAHGRPSYYVVAGAAAQLAIAYDFVYPQLSPSERQLVRAGLLRNAVAPAYFDYFENNQVPSNTSNWIGHITAGNLMALLATEEDGPPDALQRASETYFQGLSEKLLNYLHASVLSDGSYGEGFSYQDFSYESVIPLMAALEHEGGSTQLAENLYLNHSWQYPAYISYHHGDDLLDFGDSHEERSSFQNWAWLVQRSDEPGLHWLYNTLPGHDWKNLFWPSAPLRSSDTLGRLPPSKIFTEKGNAVFRTGWGDDDALLALRAGANFNHTHLDQGSFCFYAFGEKLIREAGFSNYYDDPYFWSYFIQAAGHNTLLIDHNPESQEPGDFSHYSQGFRNHATIEHSMTALGFACVDTEVGPVYHTQLKTFRRRLAMLSNGNLALCDDIASSSGPHDLSIQFFPPTYTGVSLKDNTAQFLGMKAGLGLQVFQPDAASLALLHVPNSLSDIHKLLEQPMPQYGVLQVSTPRASDEAHFLVALEPYRLQAGLATVAAEAGDSTHFGIKYASGKTEDIVFFSKAAESSPKSAEQEAVPAIEHLERLDGMLTRLDACAATACELERRRLFVADKPINATLKFSQHEEDWELSATVASHVTIFLKNGAKPASIEGAVSSIQRDQLILDIPNGNCKLTWSH